MTLVPFYGGLPPEVTADYSKVKSIGQGEWGQPGLGLELCYVYVSVCLSAMAILFPIVVH